MSTAVRLADLALDGVEPGAVYLLRSSVPAHMCHEARDLLHVISKHRGGEVRGYERPAGSSDPWRVRTPAYEGHWPEVDKAVAAAIGERVIGLDGVEVSPDQPKPYGFRVNGRGGWSDCGPEKGKPYRYATEREAYDAAALCYGSPTVGGEPVWVLTKDGEVLPW